MANSVPDTSAAATTMSVKTADTSLICIAHCPFQKGNAFGLTNVKQCRVSKKPFSIYGHLQTWHRFQTPACRIIIDAVKKQLPMSTNLNLDEATLYFPGEAPASNQQGQSTTHQYSSTQNQPLEQNNNNNNYGGTQDLATLVNLISNPLIILTQQMQQQQQSLNEIQQLIATQMQNRTEDIAARLPDASSSLPIMPDLHNLSNDNNDQSASEDDNAPSSVSSTATATKKTTVVSTRNDLPIMAARSPSPVASPPRTTAQKLMKMPPKASTKKQIEDDDENTSEEEDDYVPMVLPPAKVNQFFVKAEEFEKFLLKSGNSASSSSNYVRSIKAFYRSNNLDDSQWDAAYLVEERFIQSWVTVLSENYSTKHNNEEISSMTLTTYISHLNKLITYVANNVTLLLKPITTNELNFSNFFKLQLLEAVTRNNIKQKLYKKQSSKKMGDKAASRSSAPMIDCVATMMALYRDRRCVQFIENLEDDSPSLPPLLFSRFFFTTFARPSSIARLTLFDLLRPQRCDEIHSTITINENKNGKALECTLTKSFIQKLISMVEARLGRTVLDKAKQAMASYLTAATLSKQKSIQDADDRPVFVTPGTNTSISVHYGRHLTSGLLMLYDMIINNKETKIITSKSSKLIDRLAENYGVQFFLTMCQTLATTDIRPVANGLAGDASSSSNDLRLVDLALSHTAGTRERHYERAQRPGDSKRALGLFAQGAKRHLSI